MRAEFSKRHVPMRDYVGSHVSLKHGERILLGEITYICPDEFLCIIKHFNGEPWPFNPALSRLEILERFYEKEVFDE